jgi:hypothetical protein
MAVAVSDMTPVSLRQRHLEEQQQEGEEDISWLASYSIVYEYCFNSQQSVTYKLCPLTAYSYKMYGRNACDVYENGCATYMTDIVTFVESFSDAQMDAKQYRCDNAREACDDENGGNCYDDSLAYCQEDYNDNMNLQELLSCQQFADGYYVGPWCGDDNVGIYLRVFKDSSCTKPADDNSEYFNTFGIELPYSTTSLIGAFGDAEDQGNTNCASCMEHGKEDDKDGEDQYDEDEVLGECETIYAATYTKCETESLLKDNPDSSGCRKIEKLKKTEGKKMRKGWKIFVIVVSVAGVVAAGAYYILMKKQKRGERLIN